MQVFISWSGGASQQLAELLRDWLPGVIQQLRPFVSSTDVAKGAFWQKEISEQLEDLSQGIVCVTKDNMDRPWLNYEAGALAKLTDARVRTLLFGVAPSDVLGPLQVFQHTKAADRADMLKFLDSLNDSCASPLAKSVLSHAFDREWPDLELKLRALDEASVDLAAAEEEPPTAEEMLSEILPIVRRLGKPTQVRVPPSLAAESKNLRALVADLVRQGHVSNDELATLVDFDTSEKFGKWVEELQGTNRFGISDSSPWDTEPDSFAAGRQESTYTDEPPF